MNTVSVRRAGRHDLQSVAPLFDAYRQFYNRAPDPAGAAAYLRARFDKQESVLFVAEHPELGMVGFCQLYPAFCSVFMARFFTLYDLFMTPAARRSGGARALLSAAETFAAEHGGIRLELRTARSNLPAQTLYESTGWRRDGQFYSYSKWLVPIPPGQTTPASPVEARSPGSAI
jgi:ribosomal protein S18 acetylase RimI-like enzyme